MLRRGRVRFDYAHFNEKDQPTVHFAIQFDGTERGREYPRSLGKGLLKTNGSSSWLRVVCLPVPSDMRSISLLLIREAPERGRMSQILMRTERDLGAMVSFEPRVKDHPLKYLKVDLGAFNGQRTYRSE